jgi:hypothetical protein
MVWVEDMSLDGNHEITVGVYGYNGKAGESIGKTFVYSLKCGTASVNDFEKFNEFNLAQNYPNPFYPTTTISYSILNIYNTLRQKITTIVNKAQKKGNYSLQFNTGNLPSEIYFYRLNVYGNNASFPLFTKINKMILLK